MSPPTTTIAVAKLDANGVYWGMQTITPDDLNEQHVQVPADCDLAPGKYRWHAQHQRFDALTELQQAPEGLATLEAVVYQLVQNAQAQGATEPVFAAYAANYKRSIDAMGDAT